MPFDKKKPFNSLPLLPPGNNFIESIEVYKALSSARASLAELKGRSPIIPNPKMLINTLVLQEAMDSSEIENIVTSRDNLFRAFSSKSQNVNPFTKEVLRYREALWKAFNDIQRLGKINQDILIEIFRTITKKDEGIRDSQIYIGNAFQVTYTPPAPGKPLNDK
ncbi:MAG TPA: Fic family protein, partial [Bacteroides sp.]|nr:Fic family protein [Bacteroides sp.]